MDAFATMVSANMSGRTVSTMGWAVGIHAVVLTVPPPLPPSLHFPQVAVRRSAAFHHPTRRALLAPGHPSAAQPCTRLCPLQLWHVR